MKKLLAIAAVTALGIASPTPALASSYVNELQKLENKLDIAKAQDNVNAYCSIKHRQIHLVNEAASRGEKIIAQGYTHGRLIKQLRVEYNRNCSNGSNIVQAQSKTGQSKANSFHHIHAHKKCQYMPSSAAYRECYQRALSATNSNPYTQGFEEIFQGIGNSPEWKRHGVTLDMILNN